MGEPAASGERVEGVERGVWAWLARLPMFRSLHGFNYRMWAAGAVVSNVGTWMQRVAQDWLVLTVLTDKNATAVGIVSALQFAPQVLLLPFTGLAADRLDRRKLIFGTQTCLGLLALALGVLTLTGTVRLGHVYVLAFLLGCVTAVDAPARHTFVSDLVTEDDLGNAVALNSTSFNAARMIGPAVAGAFIAAVGTGWAFMANAASFGAVLVSLSRMRPEDLHRQDRAHRRGGAFVDGLRYVASRPDLRTILMMFLLIATFGIQFAIFISTMAVSVFHRGAGQYGLLTSVMAVGTVAGALLAAHESRPRIERLVAATVFLSAGMACAALAKSYWLFGLTLVPIGVCNQTFSTTSNSAVQLGTHADMRGRVMSILLGCVYGGAAVGAPIAGWVADHLGPRFALGEASVAELCAALIGIRFLIVHRHLRLRLHGRHVEIDDVPLLPALPSPKGL